MHYSFIKAFRRLSECLLNFLFPVECVGCGSSDDWLCLRCIATIDVPVQLSCFGCLRPTVDGQWCDECRKGKSLRGVWNSAFYTAPILRFSIHLLKYKSIVALAPSLTYLFTAFRTRWPFLFSQTMLVVPVPLHAKKQHFRGYNQAHLLAAHFLEKNGGVCGCWLLERTRHTKQQVDCSREERLQNVVDAFRYRGPNGAQWPRVMLLDDVATTGSTLESCAVVLRRAGASDVWGLVLARG